MIRPHLPEIGSYRWNWTTERLIADTIWITAPEYLIKELDTAVETLEVGARQAMAEYLAQAEEENGTNKRIKVMGTVDGTIVSAFPRWVVILLPLLAAILVCQSLFRNQKWKDAHGVFLRRSR